MSGVTDLEIYQRFTLIVQELEEMFARGPSLVGGTAIKERWRVLRVASTTVLLALL